MVQKKDTGIIEGTIRIGKNLKTYEFKSGQWKNIGRSFPNMLAVVQLFRAHKNFKELLDKKDPRFLRGQLSSEGKIQGARISILPDGKKLDGAFSIFSPGLTLHDELNHSHWDVIYLNPNGKFAYHYTLEKKKEASNHKFTNVKTFEKKYPLLEKKVLESLYDKNNFMALPMYTLLKTHIRVGNEIYYKAHGHKGLTTLKKSDVKIFGESVNFKFLGKDGVPQNITKEFPKIYISRLKTLLFNLKEKEFIFTNFRGHLLTENDFKSEFGKFIGAGFYPHIVRSYFATKETEDFLKKNKRPQKKDVKIFLESVAEELGHKKLSKKTGEWEDSYTVTIGHYIAPRLAEKLRKILKDKGD